MNAFALCAESLLPLTSTRNAVFAAVRAEEGVLMKVVSIQPVGREDVYNMEVKDTHNFVVNGGIVAHNCYDEARYFFMENPLAVKAVPKYEPIPYDPFREN